MSSFSLPYYHFLIWVVVNIRVPFWVLIIVRHLILSVPKKHHNFDNHPCESFES